VEVSPVGGGTVEIDGKSPATFPANLTFDSGKSVPVVAVPALGYAFDGWGGDLTGTINPAEISMTCPKKITANFSRSSLEVTLIVKGSGSAKLVVGDNASADTATVMATPNSGWRFDSWTGGDFDSPGSSTTEVNLDAPRTVVANFSRIMYNLDININGRGSTCPPAGSHSYAGGEIITIIATPDSGWRFDGWTGDVSDNKSATITVAVNASKNVTVDFVKVFPIWLLTLIIIVALALIGLAGYYVIRRHYRVIPKPLLTNTRSTRSSTRERRKNKRR
jgi:hypothetical protein